MQELGSSFFSCYSNILKSLFLFCPLNSVLVAVFAPASAHYWRACDHSLALHNE